MLTAAAVVHWEAGKAGEEESQEERREKTEVRKGDKTHVPGAELTCSGKAERRKAGNRLLLYVCTWHRTHYLLCFTAGFALTLGGIAYTVMATWLLGTSSNIWCCAWQREGEGMRS